MRRICLVAIVLCLLCVLTGAAAAAEAEPPVIAAESAIVVEASTGRVVYEKNADMQSSPASMTKMMTCLLAIESGRMDSIVQVSPSSS